MAVTCTSLCCSCSTCSGTKHQHTWCETTIQKKNWKNTYEWEMIYCVVVSLLTWLRLPVERRTTGTERGSSKQWCTSAEVQEPALTNIHINGRKTQKENVYKKKSTNNFKYILPSYAERRTKYRHNGGGEGWITGWMYCTVETFNHITFVVGIAREHQKTRK